jgi:membrane-bound serine protease (ClpP class)
MRKAMLHKTNGRVSGHSCALRASPPIAVITAFLCLIGTPNGLPAQDAKAPETAQSATAFLIDVPLPITDTVEKSVARRAQSARRQALPDGKQPAGPRPIFVFAFKVGDAASAGNSSFGDALDLARFISGDQLQGIEAVAWAPQTVKGHAILPLLACERIILGKDAEIGAAGTSEKGSIDDAMRAAYTEYAARKRTVPPAIAQALLDKDLAVIKVTTVDGGGVRYETEADLKRLREQGVVSKEETFLQAGDQHLLSSAKMRECSASVQLADTPRALAAALQIPLANLEQDLAPEGGWKALRIDLAGPIHKQSVNWILSSLEDHRRRGDFNLLVLTIDSGGGDLNESQRLAQHLAGLEGIHTVAFVNQDARSDAALIALACDELVMHPNGRLGGPGEGKNLSSEDLAVIRPSLEDMYRRLGRDWSLPLALVDSESEVHRYTHPLVGEVRYLSSAEAATVPNIAEWQDAGPIQTDLGLTGEQAESYGLARATADNLDDVKNLYAVEGSLAPARPNWVLAFVEWLADPRIASLLLFVGGFALLFELSTPGATVPGFIAIVCFMLFFWSKFLHGTADWLEIMLFVGGLLCLAIELFALPGFGVFGFGGGLMVIASIVLASQTFVLPTNAYQLRQFPISLAMLAAGMAGGIVSVIMIRRFLPDTPYFNRVVLKPPKPEEREALRQREALVAWDHLQNKRGTTITPLVPAGKVQFGDDLVDCISNGELIAKGTPVVVEEVSGNRVVVRKINP